MVLVLVLGTTITFSSCGGDDKDDDIYNPQTDEQPSVISSVAGTWGSTEQEYYGTKTQTLVFSPNGTGTWTTVKAHLDGTKESSDDSFTYQMITANEGTMTVTEVDSSGKTDIDTYKFNVSGNTMKIFKVKSDGSLKLEETLTKK